jgi:hypothetical protein
MLLQFSGFAHICTDYFAGNRPVREPKCPENGFKSEPETFSLLISSLFDYFSDSKENTRLEAFGNYG